MRIREAHERCVTHIENDNNTELLKYLTTNADLPVNEIVDQNGKTLIHECTFNDSLKCLKALLTLASPRMVKDDIATWIN